MSSIKTDLCLRWRTYWMQISFLNQISLLIKSVSFLDRWLYKSEIQFPIVFLLPLSLIAANLLVKVTKHDLRITPNGNYSTTHVCCFYHDRAVYFKIASNHVHQHFFWSKYCFSTSGRSAAVNALRTLEWGLFVQLNGDNIGLLFRVRLWLPTRLRRSPCSSVSTVVGCIHAANQSALQ